MSYFIEVVGWTGSLLVLLAYGLNIYQKLSSSSLWFILLNLAGSAMLIYYTIVRQAYASTFVNVVWVVIAVFGIFRYFRQNSQ